MMFDWIWNDVQLHKSQVKDLALYHFSRLSRTEGGWLG
jgi:hypothetical protein